MKKWEVIWKTIGKGEKNKLDIIRNNEWITITTEGKMDGKTEEHHL